MNSNQKDYFFEMVDMVHGKLAILEKDSLIKRYFPEKRLDAIRTLIENKKIEELEWNSWQPLFLFLKKFPAHAIEALDADLKLICSNSTATEKKVCEFISDTSEQVGPWIAGIFEIFIKATALRNTVVISELILDWKLQNGRDIDLKIELGQRSFCIECTTLGESDASKGNWEQHTKVLQTNNDATHVERQDAYTQSRRLYAKVFDKIAPEWNAGQSQLNPFGPNLLLISLSRLTSADLRAHSPSIGWALDELFANQPTGNQSPASLTEWLYRKAPATSFNIPELRVALSRISGIVIFDGCKLGTARINYHAAETHRISHAEMAIIEKLFAAPPLYAL